MSFIQREIELLNIALNSFIRPANYDELYAAQQALSWATDPVAFKSPSKMLDGMEQPECDSVDVPARNEAGSADISNASLKGLRIMAQAGAIKVPVTLTPAQDMPVGFWNNAHVRAGMPCDAGYEYEPDDQTAIKANPVTDTSRTTKVEMNGNTCTTTTVETVTFKR